ncbi:MAG: lanthionine synthetase LanC family protein [Acidimicrobiales bacterium]
MEEIDRLARGRQAEDLGRKAADWLSVRVGTMSDDPSLYHGLAGAVLGLFEADQHFRNGRYTSAVRQGADVLADVVDGADDCSLYLGLAGVAFALRTLQRDSEADRALTIIRERFDGTRWNDMFELMMGNAGIALGALHAGDVDLAVSALEPYRTKADVTAHGVNWAVRPSPPRSHHIAHGTLGIVYALADVGDAAGRTDMVELAILGANDVTSRSDAGPEYFLVPHSDPPHRPDLIERYSYGWCNGPAGDAQVFRLLERVTDQSTWSDLVDRCWRTVTESGLPQRLRPGFWDNNGRCCGTAGVLALASDRIVERADEFTFADLLIDDLTARAIVDDAGARWSNVEHRTQPNDLEPHAGWAMGNAGIVTELLRYARLCEGRSPDYAVNWPDHPLAFDKRQL